MFNEKVSSEFRVQSLERDSFKVQLENGINRDKGDKRDRSSIMPSPAPDLSHRDRDFSEITMLRTP